MDNIARVIRHAARQLWRAPLVSVASILTLAIGIGACALMMSVVSTVLLKPLPYGDPDRLVMSWGWYPNANLGFPEQPTHGAVFSIMRDNTQAFESLAAFRGASFNFGDVISPERLDGIEATGDFFAALGVAPEIGHFFERANETPGSDHVAVLSDAVWRRRFGGDPHILGRTLTLNAEPYTVIGVAAAGFAFPRGPEMPGDFQFAATPDLWVPLRPPTGGVADLAIVGRLRPRRHGPRGARGHGSRDGRGATFDPCRQEFPPGTSCSFHFDSRWSATCRRCWPACSLLCCSSS